MDLRRILISTVFAALAVAVSAAPIESTLLAPVRPVVDFATLEEAKPFQHVPTYKLESGLQIVDPSGWTDTNDFHAAVKILWSENQLAFRFDISDDVALSAAPSPAAPRGDYIKISMTGLSATVVPDTTASAFEILLAPKPQETSCDATVWSDFDGVKEAVGTVKTLMVPKTVGGYVLYVVLDTSEWTAAPSAERSLRAQVEFGDFDRPGQLDAPDHQYVLLPSAKPYKEKLLDLGTIRFVSDRWLIAKPVNTLFRVGDAAYSVSYSNLDVHERTLTIKLMTMDKKPKLVRTFENLLDIPANASAENVPVNVDLDDVPPGGYLVRAEFGITPELTDRYIGITDNRIYYDLLTIERRVPGSQRLEPRRRLTAVIKDDEARRTIRYLAGEGSILWSAGAYDAASDEFVPNMRPSGPYVMDVPAAAPDAVPWALFAHNEELSHMNRPFVVKLADEVFAGEGVLRPMLPNWKQYNDSPATRKTDSEARRLMLIGLVTTYAGPHQIARIRVQSAERTLTVQSLNPGPTAQLGGRYSYVLRVWLTDADRELHIENVADFGVYAEVDFMAVLGPGDTARALPDEPQLIFQGDESAYQFTRMVDTSAYLMRTYLVDASGRGYMSLPGGKSKGPDPVAAMLLLNELSAWRARSEAGLLARGVARDSEGIIGPSVGYTLAKPLAIMGYYNHWRRSGRSDNVINPLWGNFVLTPVAHLATDVVSHPQGLVSATGRFGDNSRESGAASYPMVMAVIGALRGAAEIAAHKRETDKADEWRAAADELEESWKKHLFTQQTSLRIDSSETFPASDNLPQTVGLSSQIPAESIVYGRFVTDSPLIYANGVRVFDTPYQFSGLTMASDVTGLTYTDAFRTRLENSLRFVLQDAELASRPAFKSYRVYDYEQADLNTWAIQAALIMDSSKLAGEMMRGLTRYTYDEMVDFPVGAVAEVSPWTFENDYNVTADGQNGGAMGDDLNAYNGVAALRLARLIAGVDDSDYHELKLIPRLPEGWTRVEAKNWLVCHDFLGGSSDLLTYSYESYPDMRYSVKIEADSRVSKLTVRVGPFEPRHLNATVVSNGKATTVPTTKVGAMKYVFLTYEDVGNLNISVQPVR